MNGQSDLRFYCPRVTVTLMPLRPMANPPRRRLVQTKVLSLSVLPCIRVASLGISGSLLPFAVDHASSGLRWSVKQLLVPTTSMHNPPLGTTRSAACGYDLRALVLLWSSA